ncbi:MAG: non-heme iron oxygenase ferredoxin subunit [Gemmatimonadales bacterium]|nr:MAG: non-heme iron oxygenase ferredoxin subunit [Gemmatimonadales bacterium]
MAEWVKVATEEECQGNGCVHAVVADGLEVVLVRLDDGIYAMEDRCSHQDFPLSEGAVENGQLECVFHGAKFDVRTGKAKQLPAIKSVRTFPVEVRDGEIFVDMS